MSGIRSGAGDQEQRSERSTLRAIALLAAGAVLLRVVLLFGRGDYVAFDEGWYVLLGRNLWSGDGFTLSGLRHVALSPMFPIVAGAVGTLIGDAIWGGRLVAAVSAGLLPIPCWYVFRRLAGARVAWVAAVFVAVMPSLAPFVVPYWIGWDLWVGAEPLLHLALFTGLALLLRAWEARDLPAAVGCGVAFAVGYLSRPEALGVFGVAGVLALGLSIGAWARGRRSASAAAPSAGGRWVTMRSWALVACAVAFTAVCAPYWLYLHDALGRWAITGRWVQVLPSSQSQMRSSMSASSNRIEDMLWRGEDAAYVRSLYALDASGTRLANGYWGVQRDGVGGPTNEDAGGPARARPAPPSTAPGVADAPVSPPATSAQPTNGASSWLLRYASALGAAVPWYVWIFAVAGLFWPGRERRWEMEALVAVPLVFTSLVIARTVAVDPRTQVFLAPLAAFYAARGVEVLGGVLAARREGLVRGALVPKLLTGALVVALLGTSLVRLGLSLAYGSPHHIVAEQNAAVGEAIRRASPEDATVVSFHPALALYADRDWRVLPLEPLDRIVRYAREQPSPFLVLSVFYPPELRPLEPPHYLIVPVPPDLPDAGAWRIAIQAPAEVLAFGALIPRE